MNKLEIEKWKYFFLGDEKYFKITRIKEHSNLSDYKFSWFKNCSSFPVVSSSKINNGTVSFVNEDEKKLNLKNSITIANNGSIGESFFQPWDFYATSDITVLRLVGRDLNKYVALFLCSIIRMEKFRYSYGRKWSLSIMKKSRILLPVDKEGEPDWDLMELFMKNLFDKVINNFYLLSSD